MVELHTLGLGAHPQSTPAFTTTSSRKANAFTVLWHSWCDAVVASQGPTGAWKLGYEGKALSSAQSIIIAQNEDLDIAFNAKDIEVEFFGSAMHEGLRGYVISDLKTENQKNHIVLFSTDLEVEKGLPEVEHYFLAGADQVVHVKVLSAGDILIGMRSGTTSRVQIIHLHDIEELRNHLTSRMRPSPSLHPLACLPITQWCTNATTSTILDGAGKVHTYMRDSRYPKCLGRPHNGAASFESVSYLSETQVLKVASGGYMTAALGSDGELFLWGQACPGSCGELEVLNDIATSGVGDAHLGLKDSRVGASGEQDDIVKCLEVYIDGQAARVYDMALGHGHVLIAAEVIRLDGNTLRAVFVAGENDRGQLGLDTACQFAEKFREVVTLRGQRVTVMSAAGWSSFVATHVG